jgi:hypothetical protein
LKIFESGEKYYFEDLGLRNNILNHSTVNQMTHTHKRVLFPMYIAHYFAGYNYSA